MLSDLGGGPALWTVADQVRDRYGLDVRENHPTCSANNHSSRSTPLSLAAAVGLELAGLGIRSRPCKRF